MQATCNKKKKDICESNEIVYSLNEVVRGLDFVYMWKNPGLFSLVTCCPAAQCSLCSPGCNITDRHSAAASHRVHFSYLMQHSGA